MTGEAPCKVTMIQNYQQNHLFVHHYTVKTVHSYLVKLTVLKFPEKLTQFKLGTILILILRKTKSRSIMSDLKCTVMPGGKISFLLVLVSYFTLVSSCVNKPQKFKNWQNSFPA